MTEKQSKAIERCRELIKESHSCWIGITNQEAITIVLSMIEEKDKQIERYINILATNDMLHVIECENKDKIIDLMANKLALYCEINCEEDIKTNKEQIRQYFENKVKEK